MIFITLMKQKPKMGNESSIPVTAKEAFEQAEENRTQIYLKQHGELWKEIHKAIEKGWNYARYVSPMKSNMKSDIKTDYIHWCKKISKTEGYNVHITYPKKNRNDGFTRGILYVTWKEKEKPWEHLKEFENDCLCSACAN